MRFSLFLLSALALATGAARGQALFSGRLLSNPLPGSDARHPFSAVLCFAGAKGPDREARGFRTWETAPSGWFRLDGAAGNYTVAFSQPSGSLRPMVLNNIYLLDGDQVEGLVLTPRFDYAVFHDKSWDPKPARGYYQTFVARGRSLTQVSFRLATDGVDGAGPGKQNVLVSVHESGLGPPDTWKQIGPAMPVLDVDSGGPKNYEWSAGWNSGEVPLQPGHVYAVHIRPEKPDGTFQAFWRPDEDTSADCYRIGPGNTGFQRHDLYMTVATDGDGLLLPYNKRVHKEFGRFGGFAHSWAQTYVAQGRSLASVILYAAVSGSQPPLSRQRVAVRVHQGGPDGPQVGLTKIAVGNGNYTGDASWGTFGLAYAPGEVPLVPGQTYALEWESIESYETLHGFVNIKGQVSDDRAGFNPYVKIPPDDYPEGAAFKLGREKMDFDLDLQVIEYQFQAAQSGLSPATGNFLRNGGMESGTISAEDPDKGTPDGWRPFSAEPDTGHLWTLEAPANTNRVLSVADGRSPQTKADGGYVQRVEGLSRFETYLLSGRLRATWPVDWEHQCLVGYDLTGQDQNPGAASIRWTVLPALHGQWEPYASPPLRPARNAISVWLRARSRFVKPFPFRADFDDFTLQRVDTGVPQQNSAKTMSPFPNPPTARR
jgi:hypothetical protein